MSRILAAALLLLVGPLAPAFAAVIVDSTMDGDDGECVLDCALREAIATSAPGEQIVVPPGTYTLSFGEVAIDSDKTLSGSGAGDTFVESSTTARSAVIRPNSEQESSTSNRAG